MLNFIKNKTNLSIMIFYFIFAITSLTLIMLAQYNNNQTPKLFIKKFIFYRLGFFVIYIFQKIPVYYI